MAISEIFFLLLAIFTGAGIQWAFPSFAPNVKDGAVYLYQGIISLIKNLYERISNKSKETT